VCQIVPAVAGKGLTPAQGNTMLAALKEMLSHYRHSKTQSNSACLSDADLASIRRTNPKVFNLLAPFLTDEQLDQILRDTDEKSDGQV
jgi:hypothetical protein